MKMIQKWVDKTRKLFKSCVLVAILSPALLTADEDRVPVGSRLMNSDAIEQIQNQKEAQAAPLKKEARSGFIFDRYPSVYYSSTVHWLTGVSAFGDSVECEDGSVWKINTYDSYKALSWRANDPLLITQNTRWFSSYNYRIINRATGASIEANLYLGPIQYGEFTRYIAFIDWVMGDIVLTDNTRWQISSYDTSLFRDWEVNDAVIVGYNSGWDSSCDSILINVNMNNFVRAKEF